MSKMRTKRTGAAHGVTLLLTMGLVSLGSVGCSDDCERGAYPAAPAGAAGQLHVSCDCPGDSPDGSADQPYGTINEAVAAAGDGSAILVAAGTCSENVSITKSVSIVGSSDPTDPAQAAAIIQAPSPYAVVVANTSEVRLRGLHVVGADGVGIWVEQVGAATIEGCRVEATTDSTAAPYGFGVLAVSSDVTIDTSSITSNAGPGVLLADADGTITDNAFNDNAGGGVRVEMAPSSVHVEGNELNGNSQFGLGSFSARGIIIIDNRVLNTALGAISGDGIVLATLQNDTTETAVEMTDNVVSGSARLGALLAGSMGGTIAGNELTANGSTDAGFGGGLWLQDGAGSATVLQINGNNLADNTHVGIGLTDGGRADIQANTVAGTLEGIVSGNIGIVHVGDGIAVFDGASASITGGNVIENSFRAGIFTDAAAGSMTTISGNTISGNDLAIVMQDQDADPVNVLANTMQNNITSDAAQSVAAGTYSVAKDAVASPGGQALVPQQ